MIGISDTCNIFALHKNWLEVLAILTLTQLNTVNYISSLQYANEILCISKFVVRKRNLQKIKNVFKNSFVFRLGLKLRKLYSRREQTVFFSLLLLSLSHHWPTDVHSLWHIFFLNRSHKIRKFGQTDPLIMSTI